MPHGKFDVPCASKWSNLMLLLWGDKLMIVKLKANITHILFHNHDGEKL